VIKTVEILNGLRCTKLLVIDFCTKSTAQTLKRTMSSIKEKTQEENTLLAFLAPRLNQLAPGSTVAVISFKGSFFPVHVEHVQSVVRARNILCGTEAIVNFSEPTVVYNECLALFQVNADGWIHRKFPAEAYISRSDREELTRMATSEYRWMHTLCRKGDGFEPNTSDTLLDALATIEFAWSSLNFDVWHLNGADDVLKYKKWEKAGVSNRLITIGRKGFTDQVIRATTHLTFSPQHFLIGVECKLAVSSNEVRRRLRHDQDCTKFLHPAVLDWCLANGVDKLRVISQNTALVPSRDLSPSCMSVVNGSSSTKNKIS